MPDRSIFVFSIAVVTITSSLGCGRIWFEELSRTGATSDASVLVSDLCSNQMLDQGEEATDCGGPCPTCGNAASCAEILAQRPNSIDAVYQIDVDSAGPTLPFAVYCDMTNGGWTLAAKMNGNNTTFVYGSALWSNGEVFNANLPGLDDNEAKLESFNVMPFTEVRLGMKQNGTTNWITLNQASASLRSIFEPNIQILSAAGRTAWLSLLQTSDLQPDCNREGFNISDDIGRNSVPVRIGILGNNEPGCGSCDSMLGFGIKGSDVLCSFAVDTTVGNAAGCVGVPQNSKVMGYVMIR